MPTREPRACKIYMIAVCLSDDDEQAQIQSSDSDSFAIMMITAEVSVGGGAREAGQAADDGLGTSSAPIVP